ncbi:hypothetical protein R6Q57_017933 [Mikania cordata]
MVCQSPSDSLGFADPTMMMVLMRWIRFTVVHDVIEDTNTNEKCCIQVLEILINKADTDIVEHEEELTGLLSQLACTDEVFSDMFFKSLRAKIDFLDSSIRKFKDDAENFMSTSREPAESIHDILKSLFCRYLQKKDLQFADDTGTASSSFCQAPADTQKKQIESSSNANQLKKIKTVDIIPVEKQTISPTIVKVEDKDTNHPYVGHVPKYPPQCLFWGSTKKTDRQVSKFQLKGPIRMKKDIVQNRTPICNSVFSKPSLKTHGKQKHPLNIIKPQNYDESMSLSTDPYVQSSEETNSMSLATIPYIESSEEANSKQIIIKELDFPPGYPNPQHSPRKSISWARSPYSTRTYTRRKKPDSPLPTTSNSPCLTLVVAKPLDRAETYSNPYMEDYYTVNDLRVIAKQQKLKGYYKFHKAELAQALGIKLIEGM